MKGKMKVAVMTAKEKMEWIERDIPQPKPGELQIKLEYVGICGSDLHFYSEGRLANWEVKEPLVLGHEPAGKITAIGDGVEGFELGDRVYLEPGVPCGHCTDCMEGNYNLCKNIKFMAIPEERDGVFSEYTTHDALWCFKLPDTVSSMAGGLMEPLSVGLHAAELSNAKLGESSVILGSGAIGLVTLMTLRARGVREIYVADMLDKRLEKAKELGATKVFNSKTDSIEEFVKTLPGGGVNQVYECAGNRVTTLLAFKLIKRAGKITLVGVSPEPILEFDAATLNAMEGEVYSVYRYKNQSQIAIDAVASGLIPLDDIVSHTFDFENVIDAVDFSLNHKDEVVKAVVKFPE